LCVYGWLLVKWYDITWKMLFLIGVYVCLTVSGLKEFSNDEENHEKA